MEDQYISKWLEWQKESTPNGPTVYTSTSYMLHYYMAATIACFYGLVLLLALLICGLKQLCCKRNRVKFSTMDKNPANELRRTASDDENYGYGKDLREFEMSQGENKWQKKNSSKKLGDRELKDFSKTVVVIDERFDEELTGPAEKSNISLSVRGNKRDKNQTGSSFMGS